MATAATVNIDIIRNYENQLINGGKFELLRCQEGILSLGYAGSGRHYDVDWRYLTERGGWTDPCAGPQCQTCRAAPVVAKGTCRDLRDQWHDEWRYVPVWTIANP